MTTFPNPHNILTATAHHASLTEMVNLIKAEERHTPDRLTRAGYLYADRGNPEKGADLIERASRLRKC